MVRLSEYPDEGDLVVGTIKEVKNFGAFAALDEFPGKEGFIHIAEVASGWVKYIRDHVREGQKVVCKVTQVNPSKGHVDLSLKQVNDHQRREKIQEWKNEQRADKLLQIVAARAGMGFEQAVKEFGADLVKTFGTAYASFEEAAANPNVLEAEGFKGPWVKHFVDVAGENIVLPTVEINGILEVSSPAPDGTEIIRQALIAAEKAGQGSVEVHYVAAPKYRVQVKGPDYKYAEATLKETVEAAVEIMKKAGGTGSFSRDE
jgi:translation initiation factor 2 subunit 1